MKTKTTALVILIFCTIQSLWADPNLVAYYSFTGNALDETGNHNTGIVNGATLTEDQFNDIDTAYYFDGSNDYIILQNGNDPNGIKQPLPMTVSAWIKPDSLMDGLVFRNDQFNNDLARYGVAMRCRPDGTIIAHVFNGGNTSNLRVSKYSAEPVVKTDQWGHFAVVFHAFVGNDIDIQLFWNGVEVPGQYDGTGTAIAYTADKNGGIGHWKYNNAYEYFHGSIDEVRVYNRALSSSEIRQLAYIEDSLMVWPLSEGRIWTYHCEDATGNTWTETRQVVGSSEINGKHFYQVRLDEKDEVIDVNVLSTNYALVGLDDQGNEWMDYVIAPEGFIVIPEPNRIRELVAIEAITVPFGGPYKAYSYGKTATDQPSLPSPFLIESFVPGIGFVKIVDHWQINPPVTKELVSIAPGPLCGEYGHYYPEGDLNQDCMVNFIDYAILSANWLSNSMPIADHVDNIDIDLCLECELKHLPGQVGYDFEFQVETDDTVEKIVFKTPQNKTFDITKGFSETLLDPNTLIQVEGEYNPDNSTYRWEYEIETTDQVNLSDFGDGLYHISVHYIDGRIQKTTGLFAMQGTGAPIPEPTQSPVISSPTEGQTVLTPVTVEWAECVDPAVNRIEVFIENETEDFEAFLLPDATQWGPIPVPAGDWYVEVDFYKSQTPPNLNPDGVPQRMSKYRKSGLYFSVTE